MGDPSESGGARTPPPTGGRTASPDTGGLSDLNGLSGKPEDKTKLSEKDVAALTYGGDLGLREKPIGPGGYDPGGIGAILAAAGQGGGGGPGMPYQQGNGQGNGNNQNNNNNQGNGNNYVVGQHQFHHGSRYIVSQPASGAVPSSETALASSGSHGPTTIINNTTIIQNGNGNTATVTNTNTTTVSNTGSSAASSPTSASQTASAQAQSGHTQLAQTHQPNQPPSTQTQPSPPTLASNGSNTPDNDDERKKLTRATHVAQQGLKGIPQNKTVLAAQGGGTTSS